MKSSESGSFLPEDVQEINYLFAEVDGSIPSTLNGLTNDTSIVWAHRDLSAEIDQLEGLEDPTSSVALEKAERKLTLLESLHSNHSKLMSDEVTPYLAAVLAGQEIEHKLTHGLWPYEGWGTEEYMPFLDYLLDGYEEFYEPRMAA
jgi:hypothetical protein